MRSGRLDLLSAPLAVMLAFALLMPPTAEAQPVISQIYGGGGNVGANFTHDFIELFNPTNAPISLAGWSIQYASATGDPSNGVCLSFPSTIVTTQIDGGATPTFAFFVRGQGIVPFDPATNRVNVRFKDQGLATRGATGVAVRTQ